MGDDEDGKEVEDEEEEPELPVTTDQLLPALNTVEEYLDALRFNFRSDFHLDLRFDRGDLRFEYCRDDLFYEKHYHFAGIVQSTDRNGQSFGKNLRPDLPIDGALLVSLNFASYVDLDVLLSCDTVRQSLLHSCILRPPLPEPPLEDQLWHCQFLE